MLKKLTIQNYALIDQIEMKFDSGLHILTGETGAGKSIILGALGLVMGNRADLKSLFDKEKNCMIEANIDIKPYAMSETLKELDIEDTDELIIRRVISKNGTSRAFVNDLPVALKTLQTLSLRLIQVHNQFDNLDLGQPAYQLKMLDALAGNKKLLTNYRDIFDAWTLEKKKIFQLKEDIAAFEREKDFVQFQYNELEQADLELCREEDLESTLEVLSNAESIKQAMQMAFFELSENDHSIIQQLNDLVRQMQIAGAGTTLVEEFAAQIQDQIEVIESLSNELYDKAENIEYDPEKIVELQTKLDVVNRLLLKHNKQDVQQLIEIKEELNQKLSAELEVSDSILETQQKIQKLESQLTDLATKLSNKRTTISIQFTKKVADQLKQLGMPHVKLAGPFEKLKSLTRDGMDAFELLFSANKGAEPESIKHVASGGELSRLSLSIKSILAGHMSLPTLIFDEIEAGISGEIALKMGNILKNLSINHQIINITHSAQIASKGDIHFFVYKSHEKNKSVTRIKTLSPDERISEIAKMLSGDPPSPTAIKNAEELVHLN